MITEDVETFERCTDTIIRQVGDVTRMVDEFSAFARTPKPQMEDHDIRDVVRAAVLDRQMTTAEIAFETKVGKDPIIVTCDRRLVGQAVSNLVKNAQEAIQAWSENANKEPGWRGRIETVVRRNGDRVDIEVIDNGAGPAQAQPQPPARALRHHQGQQGHRPRPRHRAEERGAARRHAVARGRPAGARTHARRPDPHFAAGEQGRRRRSTTA